ncbi:MAG: hypothetical protein ACPGWR_29200 [Ardenticatenaceae bacterium]
MSRIYTLTLFIIRTLFRSLTGAIPPVLTLFFYGSTFHLFPFDADYLISVGGFEMVLVCLATSFLITDKINRAATYPLVQRLSNRSDLLAATVVSSILITSILALFLVLAAVLRHQAWLTSLEILHLTIRWLVLLTFTAVFSLHLSQLVARNYSHFVSYFVLAIFVTINEQERVLLDRQLDWLVDGLDMITYPLKTTLSGATGLSISQYIQPLLFTIAYTAALSALAAWLFRRKDLLWTE